MSQCASNPYLIVIMEASQLLNAETTRLDLCPHDLVEVIKYEHGRTMPCCNLVQIPKESLQSRYRFLGVELEVNVVGIFAELAAKQRKEQIGPYMRMCECLPQAASRLPELPRSCRLLSSRSRELRILRCSVEKYRKYLINESRTSMHHLVERMQSKTSNELFGTFLKDVLHAREYNLR